MGVRLVQYLTVVQVAPHEWVMGPLGGCQAPVALQLAPRIDSDRPGCSKTFQAAGHEMIFGL